jgi:hypothetical protein
MAVTFRKVQRTESLQAIYNVSFLDKNGRAVGSLVVSEGSVRKGVIRGVRGPSWRLKHP